VRANQLHQILIRRNDANIPSSFDRQTRISGDQIVRFIARRFDRRDAIGFRRLPNKRKLGDKLRRRGRTVRLIVRIDIIAKRFAGGVENNGHATRVQLPQKLLQHVAKTVNSVNGRAVRTRHGRQGVKGPKNVPGAVN
jgi:hypothetical protein